MDYLEQILDINVTYGNEINKGLPNYITLRYKMKFVYLNEAKVVFVYPNQSIESVKTIKIHFETIKKETGCISVLILERLSSRDKQYLLKDHIPFVVEHKQIYLPFMAIYLSERGDNEITRKETLQPSSQLLLLHFIYNGCSEMMTSVAARDLNLTPMTISRATRQLEELGLIKTIKNGIQKIMCSNKSPEELFKTAKQYMINPVKKTIYVEKNKYNYLFLFGGGTALSFYSNINDSDVQCYATDSISKYERDASHKLINSDEQVALQLWRYDPRKLSKDKYVDKLSLILSFIDNKDERVEQAIEGVLNNTWSEINGKRN